MRGQGRGAGARARACRPAQHVAGTLPDSEGSAVGPTTGRRKVANRQLRTGEAEEHMRMRRSQASGGSDGVPGQALRGWRRAHQQLRQRGRHPRQRLQHLDCVHRCQWVVRRVLQGPRSVRAQPHAVQRVVHPGPRARDRMPPCYQARCPIVPASVLSCRSRVTQTYQIRHVAPCLLT